MKTALLLRCVMSQRGELVSSIKKKKEQSFRNIHGMEIGGAMETRKQLVLCNVWSGEGLSPVMLERMKRNPRAHRALVITITSYYCTLQHLPVYCTK